MNNMELCSWEQIILMCSASLLLLDDSSKLGDASIIKRKVGRTLTCLISVNGQQ